MEDKELISTFQVPLVELFENKYKLQKLLGIKPDELLYYEFENLLNLKISKKSSNF